VVSVVFADLVGYTKMAEGLDPEQVKNLVDGCFERLVADVVSFGGRVDKIIGDAIVALFGAPVAHEDDAERAVRAALRMQGTLRAYADSLGLGVQMRIGVNTGEVLVGALRAGGDYTAMGDVVNAAQRLQTAAPPGGILVGPATRSATVGVIRYESVGPVQARNRDEPIDGWLAVEALAPPGRRARKVKAPFIGRDTELALLVDGIRLAVNHCRPFLAAVEGEGGVGKSRLVREALLRAREAVPLTVLVGRCMPYGESNPWHPIATAIAGHVGLDPGADPAEAKAQLETAVKAVVEDVADPTRVTVGLLHLLGHPTPLDAIDRVRAREEVVQAVLAYLHGLAGVGPVLVVVADLDWADALLVDLLERTLAQLTGLPFAVMTTARPGVDHWPPPPGRHNTLVLRLDALDPASASELAAAMLGAEVDDEVRSTLLGRSGGNPLFLEELAAMVTECGSVGELPDTLRGLVAARLDRLDPAERDMLDNAAVLGPSGTWHGLVKFGEELRQSPRRETLAALADAELLDVTGDHWTFRSESVRNVTYQTITKAARAQRHAGVARAIEDDVKTESAVELVAYHYAAAARLVQDIGPVHGVPADVGFRAAAAFDRAASRALDQMVPTATVRLASEGLDVLTGNDPAADRQRRHLLLLRGRARVEMHDAEPARVDAFDALEAARLAEDEVGVASAYALLAEVDVQAGRIDNAVASFTASVAAWRAVGDRRGLAETQRAWGKACLVSGALAEAERHLVEAQEVFVEEGDRRGQAWVDQHRAWIAFMRGDMAVAEERLGHAEAAFRQLDDRGGLSWVQGLLAYVRFHQGRFAEAEELAVEVSTDAALREEHWGRAMMIALQATLRLWTGSVEECITLSEEARAIFRGLSDRFGETQVLGPLTRALVAVGRVADANRIVEEGRVLATPFGLQGYSSTIAAGVAVHLGDGERAAREARLAAEELEDSREAGYDAQVTLALGLLQQGEVAGAAEVLAELPDAELVRPYGSAVATLVHAADGRLDEALSAAATVAHAEGASYLDRVLALVGTGLAVVRADGEAAAEPLDEAAAIAVAAGDLVAQAIVEAAAAEAGCLRGDPDAGAWRAGALNSFATLGIDPTGWVRTLRLVAGAVELAP
jgi:class 3 adenylate cyclase/tetratricopeptide (TPR) repeat protein